MDMDMKKDLVCGMEVDPKTAPAQTTYQGNTYYFCSTECKQDFDKDPQKYIKANMEGTGPKSMPR